MEDHMDTSEKSVGQSTEDKAEGKQPSKQPASGEQTGRALQQQQSYGHYPAQGYPGGAQGYPHGDGYLQYPHVGQQGQPGVGYPQNPQAGQTGSGYPQNIQAGQTGSGYPHNPQTGQPESGYPQNPQTGQPESGYPQNPPGISQPYNTTQQPPGQQPSQEYSYQPYFETRYNCFMWFHPQSGWQPGPPPYQGHGYPQQQQHQQQQQQQDVQGFQQQQQQHMQQNIPATPPPSYNESMMIVEPEPEKTLIKDQCEKEKLIDANRKQDEESVPTETVPPQDEEEIFEPTLGGGEMNSAHCVEVHGLPVGVSADSISLYFENKRKSGGGTVSHVEMVGDRVARVCFQNIDAFERVLAKNDHKISSALVEVTRYIPGHSDNNDTRLEEENKGDKTFEATFNQREPLVQRSDFKGDNSRQLEIPVIDIQADTDQLSQAVTTVDDVQADRFQLSQPVVTGDDVQADRFQLSQPVATIDDVQADTVVVRGSEGISEDMVSLYFENKKKSGGGDVKEILTSPSGGLLIIFEDPSVAERVLGREHKLNAQVLEVSLYTPPAPEPEPEPEGPPDTIVVRNCSSLTEETLEMYFENKKSGGGDVKEIRRNGDDIVYITFDLPEVVQNVLQKSPHRFQNQEMDVSVYVPERVSTAPPPPPTTVSVLGCGGINEETLEMYFENKRRSGGGDLQSVTKGDNQDEFLLDFIDPEIAAAVSMREHMIEGRTLEVSLVSRQPSKQPKFASTSRPDHDPNLYWSSSSEEDEEEESMYVLEVQGITDSMTEDTLELFFENRRRSGGGDIECMELDRASGTLLVYFVEPNVVKRVLQKSPLLLDKKQLNVSAYLPGTQAGGSEDSPLKGLKDGTVVMISGFDPETSDDTLELYFENKRRSGGEDIQKILTVETEEGCVKYIVYSSREVAERVASKKHKVEGRQINASPYQAPAPPPPQPKYPDKFLIRGLKESTPREKLDKYMQDKLDCHPQKLVYGDEPGTVLVTLDTGTDIRKKLKKMKKVVKKRPLQGAYLRLSSVPVSNCLMVSGLDQKTTETTLSLYFESRKAGNLDQCDVEKVVMVEDSNQALVYFSDHKVIQSVLDKSHKLDGRTLKASLYTECLGVGGGQKDPMWFKLPKPFTIKDLDPYKLKFIKDSKANCKNFEKQVESGFSRIKSMSDASVTLECVLTKGTPDARKKVKNWRREAEDDITHFLDLLISEKVNVLQQVWTDVMEKIPTLKMPRPEAATIFAFDGSNQIVVVGHKMPAEKLLKQIQDKVEEVEDFHERKKKEITESVTSAKPFQLQLLMASDFPRSMMEKYDGMRVEINIDKNEITFIGLMSDVKNAMINMYESCSHFKDTTVNMSDAQIQFVKKDSFREYLVKKLRQKNLCGVWDGEKGKLKVVSRSDPDVADVAHMVKQSACQQDIDLDVESVPLLSSPDWMKLCDSQIKSNGELVRIIPAANKSKIVLVATDELIASLAEDVNNFIRDNTVYEDTVRFPKGIQRFMVRHYENEIKQLESKFQSYSVNIRFHKNSPEFTVKGTKHGMQIITSELVKLSKDVIWKKHVFDKPGIANLIRSEKGDSHIFTIENSERCVIEKTHDETQQVIFGDRKRQRIMQTATGGPKVVVSCALGSGRTLHVSQGDITKMQVGAVVNAANQQLAHIGGLAKAIVDRAGQSVQDESRDIVSRRGDIGVGEVAVTRPGKLSCSFIIHAVGPIWSNGRNDDEGQLQEAIFNSLEEAGRRQLSSIAIPALSTGIYKYPVGEATKAIVEAIETHFRDNPSSALQDVFVCDNNVNTVQKFIKALEGRFGKSSVQKSSERDSEQDTIYSRGYEEWEEDEEKLDERPGRHSRRGRRGRGDSYGNKNEQQNRQTGGSSSINAYHVISEIAKEQVDVIINTTSHGLDLTNGAVSKSLLAAGGMGIQQECQTNYPSGINSGQFAVTSGGNLRCQFILHTCLPSWKGDREHQQQQMLSDLVKSCLRKASRDKCRSLAFPALGTGNLRYPADIVAQIMYEAVDDFSTSNPDSSIQEVKFVLHHRDTATIKAFQDCERGRGGAVGGGRASGRRKGRNFDTTTKPDLAYDRDDRDDDGWTHVSSSDIEAVFSIGGVKLTVKQGDLTKEKVKCIVNSTNNELDFSKGAVSKELARVGGSDLLDEVALKQAEMSKKGVIISSGKGLKANFIVHVSTDFFGQDWKKIIIKSLKEAEKGRGVTSIAFPALGTGQYQTAPEDIAQKLIEAIVEYAKSSGANMITDIRMVIYLKEMLSPFIAAVNTAFSSKKSDKGLFKKAYEWVTGNDENLDPKGKTQMVSRTQESPTVTLYFFSEDNYTIDHAIRRVNQHYNDNTTDQVISKDILKRPSASLKRKIENLKQKYSIHLDYNEHHGSVRVNGLTADIIKVIEDVHQIIHDTQSQAHESEKAKMLSEFIQWSFIDDGAGGSGKAEEYDKIANQTIEAAYNDGKNCVRISDTSGDSYIVDFQKMVEYPVRNPRDTVAVVRKEKISGGAAFEPPAEWTPMTSDCELIQVTSGTPEYNKVVQQFTATLGRASNVQQIERVQNKYLWQQYVAKKQQLDSQNQGHQNERILWHGTSLDAVPSIYKHGFNRSYCGKNAVAIGNGVYFAVQTRYSSQNTYSVPDHSGRKHMFMARVLTGMSIRGQSGLRVPPVRDATKHILFDSVSDNPIAPGMFVIFNDTQAYPDYLITFM